MIATGGNVSLQWTEEVFLPLFYVLNRPDVIGCS